MFGNIIFFKLVPGGVSDLINQNNCDVETYRKSLKVNKIPTKFQKKISKILNLFFHFFLNPKTKHHNPQICHIYRRKTKLKLADNNNYLPLHDDCFVATTSVMNLVQKRPDQCQCTMWPKKHMKSHSNYSFIRTLPDITTSGPEVRQIVWKPDVCLSGPRILTIKIKKIQKKI